MIVQELSVAYVAGMMGAGSASSSTCRWRQGRIRRRAPCLLLPAPANRMLAAAELCSTPGAQSASRLNSTACTPSRSRSAGLHAAYLAPAQHLTLPPPTHTLSLPLTQVHTVPTKVTGKCGSVTIRLIPAPRGAGIVAARVPKKVGRAGSRGASRVGAAA